jgi:hypothetical protein
MKNLLSHITELLNKPLNFSSFDSSSVGEVYMTRYFHHDGKIYSLGDDMDENTKLIDSFGYGEKDKIPAVAYHISFHNDRITSEMAKEIAEFMNVDKSVIENGVYEISFERMEGTIEKVAIPFRRGGTWMMKKVGSAVDDDLSRLDTKEAVAVFGTVMAASLDFVNEKNPAGLFYGIKKNAKMARSRIYDKIAQRNGGRLVSLPDRNSLKGVRLVWFR